jgi:hypothetical protein
MQKKLISAIALVLASGAGSAGAQTSVSADVTANTTWGGAANPCPIILENPIFVKSGAKLTILPGCIVRGQPRSAYTGGFSGTPGAIIVTQTGRIVADGSPSNPIIMTTAAVDNDDDGVADDDDGNGFKDAWVPGDLFHDDDPINAPVAPLNKAGDSNVRLWGGLVILGNAPTNNAAGSGAYGEGFLNTLVTFGLYGGVLPHDNSGIVRFVSIRHAGDEIFQAGSGETYLGGLTLGGVGDGTIVENVEVYASYADGIEWRGGTVSGRNLVVSYVGDDMFDVDDGYTGTNQFLFGVMPFFDENDGQAYGSASGDKGMELDGDNYRPDNVALNDNVNVRSDVTLTDDDPTPWPLSNPQLYNVTIIGSTPDAGQDFTPVDVNSTNRGIQFRNGFAGTVWNSIVVNTGAETGIEVDTTIGAGAPGFDAITNANNGLIALVCSTLASGAAPAAQETTVISNGNALNLALGGSAAGNNVVNGAFNGLTKEDQTFDPTGNAQGKLDSSLKPSPINPRPAAGFTGVAGCLAPRGPGLDANATYRGAFLRTVPTLWTTGWTVLNASGLLAD